MKCWKCQKEMHREDGKEASPGIKFDISMQDEPSKDCVTISSNLRTPENIAYNNLQLGKYSDGNGECHVAICYECYIDTLFGIK